MTRDPLYQDILHALNGDLDGDAFERCVHDLLFDAYPTLVPMVGGDDAGFDAAIGTAEGPYPVCCTVDKRGPLGNFKKNISTYLKKRPDGPRRAVVATPRAMTARKKRNLEDAAKKDFDVQVVNIHDQSYFALRLYRHDKWRRELLGLTGDPPALSVLPKHPRPDNPPLTGRDDDLRWLKSYLPQKGTKGDLLLIGQPGLGKTYLHQQMVFTGDALFAVDSDSERLANAIRSQNPKVIVIDDAHEVTEILRSLIRLRAQLHADFSIHANCWPHAKAKVMAALDLPEDATHQLQPLTRSEVRQLIEELGIAGPDRLLYLLLGQAEGKPGLAAALVAAVDRGEYKSLWTGETIARRLLDAKDALGDETTRLILATVGLGGDAGLTVEETACFLQTSPLDISRRVTQLAAGGVVEEVLNHWDSTAPRLSVRPPVLRGLLARECFWGSPAGLDPTSIVTALREDGSRRRGLAHTLMDARMRGAAIPDDILFEMVNEASGSDGYKLWEHLAAVDEQMASKILDQKPTVAHLAADGLLSFYPERTLAVLLDMAASNESESEVEAPRRRIKEWIQGDEPGVDVTIERRQLLLQVVEQKIRTGEPSSFQDYAWALSAAMHPGVNFLRTTPDDALKVVTYFGLLSHIHLKEIAVLWPQVLKLIKKASVVPKEIRKTIHDWCYPSLHTRSKAPAQADCDFMDATANEMMASILPILRRAGLTWAKDLSRRVDLGVSVPVDRTFHRIFGREDIREDHKTRQARRQLIFDALIKDFLNQSPQTVMAELATMESEAAAFEEIRSWDRNYMYWQIIREASNPLDWLEAAMKARIPATFLTTMLNAAQGLSLDSNVKILRFMLETEEYRWQAVTPILSLIEPPDDMLAVAMETLSDCKDNDTVGYSISAAAPTNATMQKLLSHPDQRIRSLSAIAEWKIEPEAVIRENLQDQWREAILEAGREDEYDLEQIFKSDLDLALEWALLKIRASSGDQPDRLRLWEYDRVFLPIIKLLSIDRRWMLLKEIDLGSYTEDIVNSLLGSEKKLINRWLNKHRSTEECGRYLALYPLQRREVDDVWVQFAIQALNMGFSSEEIADTVGLHSRASFGPFSDRYKAYIPVFKKLAMHPDSRLHLAAKQGLDWAQSNYERELANERQNAVRGRL